MFREFSVKVPWGKLHARNWKVPIEQANNHASAKVILLHGNSDHVACFDWMAQKLPDDWSVVAIDLPGHGRSNLPENFYSTMADIFLKMS